MIKERLKFYADTPRGEVNKLFCWEVDILSLEDAIFRFFAKGFHIRAAWYEKIDAENGYMIENTKLTVQDLFDKFSSLSPKEQKVYL